MLQERLQNEEFEKADDETRALLIRLAGPDAEKRGWVYFTEVDLPSPVYLFEHKEIGFTAYFQISAYLHLGGATS